MDNDIISIRGVDCYEKDGTVYLSLEAVARGLGFVQTQKKRGVEYTSIRWERIMEYLDEFGFPQKWGKDSYIPENIFYRLAMKAKSGVAEKFQSLVADEIIPSIRKHGAYLTDEATDKLFQDPDTFARLAVAWRDEARLRKEAEAKIEADKPKVLLADSITESKSDILIGELAKILKQNGVRTGQNRLFERLRQDGYLISRAGLDYNMPTQKSMELGLMRVKEGTFTGCSNNVYLTKTVRITGKGQLYFVNKYAGKTAQ